MKVLHINKSDFRGGAAVAALRLLDALRASGTDARMLTLESSGQSEAVEKLQVYPLVEKMKFLGEALSFVPHEKSRQHRFAFSQGRFGFDISCHPLIREADILHLHWVNQGFVSLQGLRNLIGTGKPIVWTLHDTWPFTGGCHYPGSCGGFTSTCGQCPLLRKPGPRDLSAKQFEKKEEMYTNAALCFVGCSQWMQQLAGKSTLVRKDLHHSVQQIFNPVPIDLFRPVETAVTRKQLGLPLDKKLVLLGAANVNDPRKGIDLLMKTLRHLSQRDSSCIDQLQLMIFGKNAAALQNHLPYKVHSFDVVKSQQEMARLYQAADLFVLPSMQDNLPNTVVESMACGTPVVAFNIGGVPEMVIHQENGFLASAGKIKELADGIRYVLAHAESLGLHARKFAEKNFAPEIVARQYQNIYNGLLKK